MDNLCIYAHVSFFLSFLNVIHPAMVVNQVPRIYKEMESVGCTPDRKAREMLQTASMFFEQRSNEFMPRI